MPVDRPRHNVVTINGGAPITSTPSRSSWTSSAIGRTFEAKGDVKVSEKRDAYVAKLKAKIDDWNAEISSLEARAHQVGANSKAEVQRQLDNAKARRDDVVAKVEGLRQAGDDAWKELKGGVKGSLKELDRAVRAASSKFSRTPKS